MRRTGRLSPEREMVVPALGRALSFMRMLWAVAHGLESGSKRMLSTLGVTGPQRLVVRLVAHHGSMSAGELARALCIHPSSLTGMLRRLERAGLIRRRRDPLDGRRVVLSLTAAGKRLNAQRHGTVEAVVERALSATSLADQRSVERVLGVLSAEFDAEFGRSLE